MQKRFVRTAEKCFWQGNINFYARSAERKGRVMAEEKARQKHGTGGQVNRMRLIDADELIKDRVENDPIRIAAECAPTAFDREKVRRQLIELRNVEIYKPDSIDRYTEARTQGRYSAFLEAISIVKKGGIE